MDQWRKVFIGGFICGITVVCVVGGIVFDRYLARQTKSSVMIENSGGYWRGKTR